MLGYRPVEGYQNASAVTAAIPSFARNKRTIYIAISLLALFCLWFTRAISLSSDISSYDSFRPSSAIPGQNVAAIIETRPMSNLIPLILHFSSVLGPGWPIHFFTDLTPASFHPPSAALARAIAQGTVVIHPLPKDQVFSNHDTVSQFLTTPWFWEQLDPAGHVLIFQADSIVCANSPSSIDAFTRFDFIGAPIATNLGHGDEGMNGGLSLRNRTMVLDIIRKHSWKKELEETVEKTPKEMYEDQWLYQKMLRWPGARLPDIGDNGEARRFSVESMWYEQPLGYHQIARWNLDREQEIAKYCPEYKMSTADFIVD